MRQRKFPTLAVILLVFAIVWMLSAFGVIPSMEFPWLPVILVIIAIGMIANRYR